MTCNWIKVQKKYVYMFVFTSSQKRVRDFIIHWFIDSWIVIGILKQNINNTLHDKEIRLVHIPVI